MTEHKQKFSERHWTTYIVLVTLVMFIFFVVDLGGLYLCYQVIIRAHVWWQYLFVLPFGFVSFMITGFFCLTAAFFFTED